MQNEAETIVLGIDPGSRITGFGVIACQQARYRYLTCGCIRAGENDLLSRLARVNGGISALLTRYTIDAVAIEQVFVCHNVQTALKLGQARGAALAAIAAHHVKTGETPPVLAEYAPRLIKKAIVGYGAADKQQMQKMVQRLLFLSDLPSVDAADALAIALCHAFRGACF